MGNIRFSPGAEKELKKALRFYREFHWGIQPDKVLSVKHGKTPKAFCQLGFLRSVTYQTSKKGDKGDSLYVHSFDKPFPILACDPQGKQLFILAGRYTVTEDGIVH